MTNAGVVARTRGALIDVFLAVKARKSVFTITAEKEKSLILIFHLRWKKKRSICCQLAYAQKGKKIIIGLIILITHHI